MKVKGEIIGISTGFWFGVLGLAKLNIKPRRE